MRISSRCWWAAPLLFSLICPAYAAGTPDAAIDRYLAPYVQGNNFSGVVLVAKGDKLLFERAYGYAALDHRVANTLATRFHIASLSMQFTAAAIMRLVDAGKLELDAPVAKILPGFAHGDEITLRELLTETSGLTDINSLPDYDEVLLHPQTPTTLVAKVEGKPLLFTPGSRYLHEEHSAYNLLALILEKTTGLGFDAALRREVFAPLGMQACGADDSGHVVIPDLAEGYAPTGVQGLSRAPYLDWSAKTGSGSVYCTAGDELKWVQGFMHDALLSPRSRGIMLADSTAHLGYGWFSGSSKRFGGPIYYMNGRSPGYASYLAYLPQRQLTVIVLSNVYVSVTSQIGADVAAIALGEPYSAAPVPQGPLDAVALKGMEGQFRFGADFYQPKGVLTLQTQGGDVFLKWGDGSLSPLIPVGPDRFIDRGYWEEVSLERHAQGHIVILHYDRFQGSRLP
jgi:CubicO group peptidase (beta-lactamase class C family)